MTIRTLDEQLGRADELAKAAAETGPESAGQSGDSQALSTAADSADQSVAELADDGQSLEADAVAGSEDGADHPERPVHTHGEDPSPAQERARFQEGANDEKA